jgi:hypothetical protein
VNALIELREHLREAARREIEGERVRRRRTRRRGAGFVAAVLLSGTAAATATDLISVGEPLDDAQPEMTHFRAATGAPDLVLTAGSQGRYPFGAAIYTARNGRRCIIAGQLRGSRLGLVRNGSFRPYGTFPADTCGQSQAFFSSRDIGGETIVYGRARKGTQAVRIHGRQQPVGRGESFLFVFRRVPVTHTWDVDYIRDSASAR